MSKFKFNIGDKVKIAKSSKYYGEDPWHNPSDVEGTVREYGGLGIRVQWKNAGLNSYTEADLESTKVVTAQEKSLTAWGLEIDGKLTAKTYPSRELARSAMAVNKYKRLHDKAVVRKVKIEVVKGR